MQLVLERNVGWSEKLLERLVNELNPICLGSILNHRWAFSIDQVYHVEGLLRLQDLCCKLGDLSRDNLQVS